ncbi:hypothetical protein DM02DRAFT_574711 [Periconia macrospinosa]|uniref:Zn(2)-C6 fungal-type domain-containing protein n=1 Tax=Periconia macrospinosa TaxID=97972 RepID=A0A2V1D6K9_9PLEO|nr:hypothetical protein DM02DRAFT_574711 [Periconia macrospinosa]
MPEEKWAAHGGVAACDLCHSRKVKCDREDPCGNCVNAKADCLRNRQKPPPRQRMKTDDKLMALLQKVSSLENAISAGASRDTRLLNPTTQSPSEDDRSSSRGSKRKRTSEPPPHNLLSPSGSLSSRHQSPNNARELLQEELSHNSRLLSYQQNVLQTAVSLADELSKSSSCTTESIVWNKVPTDLAPGELIQVLVQTKRNNSGSSSWNLHTLDHLPSKALERMVLGLLEGKEDERTLNMYNVNVHFKAALGLYASQLEVPLDADSRVHIKKMQLHHLNAALTALETVSFLTPPSLLLLQTLLTGAILMQIVGNFTSCWSLTTNASRTLIQLGYHIRCEADINDDMIEIHAAVAWCYHFDRLLSLLLLRPLSLPPYDVPVASVVQQDATNPMSIFASFMLKTVPIMEKIVELTVGSTHDKAAVRTIVEQLQTKMEEIYSAMQLQKVRSKHFLASNRDYILHWQSLEFRYYALLTSIHRLSPSVVTDPCEREKCLASARKALEYVKEIQYLGKQQGHFVEDFSPYLSWTILSYPLTPFYILFCNIVATPPSTSTSSDYHLLASVASSLSSLVVENKYVHRLQRLCTTLLTLCKPLVVHDIITPSPAWGQQQQQHQQHQQGKHGMIDVNALPSSSNHEEALLLAAGTHLGDNTATGIPAPPPPPPPPRDEAATAEQDTTSATMMIAPPPPPPSSSSSSFFPPSSWNYVDEEGGGAEEMMMSLLFHQQPSLEWFNSEVLDGLGDVGW